MHTLIEILRPLAGLIAGAVIGVGFGMLQQMARRKNEQRQLNGRLNSGWAVMPGSGGRVACLLIALALVQIACPAFFADGTQWWVSGGLVVSYGVMLFQQLRQGRARGV